LAERRKNNPSCLSSVLAVLEVVILTCNEDGGLLAARRLTCPFVHLFPEKMQCPATACLQLLLAYLCRVMPAGLFDPRCEGSPADITMLARADAEDW